MVNVATVPNDPNKAWLKRLLTPRAARPFLPAPERRREPEQQARPKAILPPAFELPAAQPKRKRPEPESGPRAKPAAEPEHAPNPEPMRGREIKESERLKSARAILIEQALEFGGSLGRNPSEEALGELREMWTVIRALKGEIERVEGLEDRAAMLARSRGKGRTR